MDYTQANLGRIFILRLHHGEILHKIIEAFAQEKSVTSALCFFLGGADDRSKLVVGPKDGNVLPVEPMSTLLNGVHEGCGVGTIFVDEDGRPKLHMHASFGRNETAITGCVRLGVEVWRIGEIVILELTDSSARRLREKSTGFELLETR